MLIATSDTLHAGPTTFAVDLFQIKLCELLELEKPHNDDIPNFIGRVNDKQANLLRVYLDDILDDKDVYEVSAHIVDEQAIATLENEYKTKAKLADRRAYLVNWWQAERGAVDLLCDEVDNHTHESDGASLVSAGGDDDHADKHAGEPSKAKAKRPQTITITGKEAIQKARAAAEAAGDTATADMLRASEDIPGAVVVIVAGNSPVARAVKPARQRPDRAPSNDRFSTMSLEELRAAAKEMFGVETNMKAIPHLKYRLRNGQRAIDAGEKPQWEQPANGIRLKIDVARNILTYLKGNAPNLCQAWIGELETSISKAVSRGQ